MIEVVRVRKGQLHHSIFHWVEAFVLAELKDQYQIVINTPRGGTGILYVTGLLFPFFFNYYYYYFFFGLLFLDCFPFVPVSLTSLKIFNY